MNQKVRVLNVLHSFGTGGAEKLLLSLMKKHNQTDFAWAICGLFEPYRDSILSEFESRGLICYDLKIPAWSFKRHPVRTMRKFINLVGNFKRVVTEFKPDIIHAHLFLPSFLSQILFAHSNIKLVSTFHSTVYPAGWMHYARKFSTWYAKPVCIACSEAAYRVCVDSGLCPDKQLITISNGVDTDFFTRAVAEEPKDNPFQVIPEACKIIQVGNLEPYKGHQFTLQAVKMLKDKGVRLYVCFAGCGSGLEKLKAAAEQLGISDMVKFLGNRADVRNLLKASDIYIMPSLYEGLSIALLEAMSMELPVVASAVGGAPEVIQDGISGFLIPPADAAALADKIELLANNPQLRLEMGRAARKRVEQSYSLAKQARQLEELYKNLAKERL